MKTISMRLPADEKTKLQEKAQQAGLSLSEFIRKAALGCEVRNDGCKQKILSVICVYHNRIDDAKTLDEVKELVHEEEREIYGNL